LLNDEALLEKVQVLDTQVVALKQYYTHTKNPVTVVSVRKKKPQQKLLKKLKALKAHIKVAVIVDHANNDLNDPYMLLWRVVNNIDASRDVMLKSIIGVDATNKGEIDGFEREWPGDTFCTKEVLDGLQEKGLIDIDEAFIRKFGLLPFK
jgi:4-hydroxy-3-polyprenylbenzoate decarboxylase